MLGVVNTVTNDIVCFVGSLSPKKISIVGSLSPKKKFSDILTFLFSVN